MTQPTIPQPPLAAPARNGFGVAALVLGIIGAVFSWIPVLGGILAVLAIVFGALGFHRARTGTATNLGVAIAGLVLGAVALVIQIIVIAAVGSAVNQTHGTITTGALFTAALPTTSNDAMADVRITKCSGGGGPLGMGAVAVQVTNHTSAVQSYLVTVSLNDAAGNRVAEANGASNSVGPGQSAAADLLAPAARDVAQCTVAHVTRIQD